MQHQETGALPLEWPSGGFQWKPSWRRELPCVRGIHAPPLEPLQVLLANPALLADSKDSYPEYELAKLAKAAGRDWTSWRAATLRERMAGISELPADPEVWLELMAQVASTTTYRTFSWRPLDWVVRVCIGLHGLTFAWKAGLGLWDATLNNGALWCFMFPSLRQAIACAPEPEYQEALALAEALRKQSEASERACAHLFPHLVDWAQAWLARHDDHQLMLRDCALPAADFAHYLQKYNYRLSQEPFLPALYLQLHLHGEACFDALAFLYRHGSLSLAVLTRMRVPQLIPALVADVQDKKVREALEKLASDYPVAVLKTLIEHNPAGRNRAIEAWTVRLALNHPGAVAGVLAHLDAPLRARFEATLQALAPQEAPAAELPALLREPPWLREDRPGELPAFDMATLPTDEGIVWQARQLEDAKKYQPSSWGERRVPDPCGFPKALCITPAGGQRLLQGLSLAEADVVPGPYHTVNVDNVLLSPAASQLALWSSYPARLWDAYSNSAIRALLAAYGVAAIAGLSRYLQAHEKQADLGVLVDSPRLVGHMLHLLRHSRTQRNTAAAWVKDFARTVLYQALPQAFATEHSVARDNAREGLRWLISEGFEPLAREVVAAYGPPMPAALEALKRTDPLHVLPGVMPTLPDFFQAASFRRPVLTQGGALPLAAVEHIGSMLLIGQPDAPYPGLALVKQACTSASLGDFAWDLYEAWSLAGGSAKNDWAFTALGLLGDDETARRLMPRIQEWSVGANSVLRYRASRALSLLAAIGSDVALMHLNVLATKAKNKTLQERAKYMVGAVAKARGLSMDELGDRLVPSLGLEHDGALELDFGPRKFSLAFDEALRPFVRDAKGARLKDLPKPNKSDDAALALAATQRYKDLKKDCRALSSLQVTRLEWAMIHQRRWPAAEFCRFFLEHPLVRHLAARLVWGVYEGARCTQTLRVAEDFTLADADDRHVDLPEDATVGIPHVLEIEPQALAAMGQVFADYEIAQPFKQLGRETYALSDEERQQTALTRFENRDVASGGILGLIHRGWERGPAQERGMISDFTRRVSGGLEVVLFFTPGIYAGGGMLEPLQTLETVCLWRDGERGRESVPFSSLDPVLASEILRDLESLPAA